VQRIPREHGTPTPRLRAGVKKETNHAPRHSCYHHQARHHDLGQIFDYA
jgi:hypothetical protein